MLLTVVLAYLHVVSAIGWLGGGLMFGFVIAPNLAKMAPASSRDFTLKAVPGVIRFLQIIAASTILFGFLLLYNMTNGDFGMLTSSRWGLDLSLGMTTALAAFVVSEAGASPAMQRVVELQRPTPADPNAVPPGVPAASNRARALAILTAVLLFVTLAFMVAAGFY